jgi:hypothetical protein
MRMHRLFIAVLAFCLAGFVPLVSGTSANAAEPAAKAAGASAELQRLLPRREIVFKFKSNGATYNFLGKVQNGKNTKILLMRANTKKGKYSVFKQGRTNARGNFSWKGLRKAGWFYVKVPGNSKWATSKSDLIHVYYI